MSTNIRFSVDEILRMFGATYRTIDIRSAAVARAEIWANVYAVVRLSYEEPTQAEARLRKLEKDHGVVHTKTLRVMLGQRPFCEWDEFCAELTRGRLHIGKEEIHLAQPVSFAQERTYLHSDYVEIRPFDSISWPVAHFRLFRHESTPLMDDALVREAVKLGYSDAHEAVNLLCELNVRAHQSNGYHFWLSLPVFAAISEVSASLKERRMEVAIKRHRNQSSLKGTAVFWGPRNVAGEPPKHRVTIEKFSDGGGSEVLRSGSASVRLMKVEEYDSVEVKLIHPEAGELHSFNSYGIRNLVPPAERNILYEALKFFCPESELRALLCSPHMKKRKRLKPDSAFELHVAWLLGLFGLSTVVLGEYEHIVAPETKVRRGSVDILAASQRHKKLVLVACTIGTPKEEDFANLVATAEILAREVYADTSVRILGLLCTAVPGYPPYRDSGNRLSGLPVLDADRFEILLKLLKTGRERDFISFLDNPIYSELRDPDARVMG